MIERNFVFYNWMLNCDTSDKVVISKYRLQLTCGESPSSTFFNDNSSISYVELVSSPCGIDLCVQQK